MTTSKMDVKNMLPNLSDYDDYLPTTSCYLDGAYFNLVFRDYPGLIKEPLIISLSNGQYTARMAKTDYRKNYLALLHVIIETPQERHANLVIISNTNAFWFDPFSVVPENEEYPDIAFPVDVVRKVIKDYLGLYFNVKIMKDLWTIPGINENVYVLSGVENFTDKYITEEFKEKKEYYPNELEYDRLMSDSPYVDIAKSHNKTIKELIDATDKAEDVDLNCDEGGPGYCVAFCIKYAYDLLSGNKYDPRDIRRFAAKIESFYGPIPASLRSIEYGWSYYNVQPNSDDGVCPMQKIYGRPCGS